MKEETADCQSTASRNSYSSGNLPQVPLQHYLIHRGSAFHPSHSSKCLTGSLSFQYRPDLDLFHCIVCTLTYANVEPRLVLSMVCPLQEQVKSRFCPTLGGTYCPHQLSFLQAMTHQHSGAQVKLLGQLGDIDVHRNQVALVILLYLADYVCHPLKLPLCPCHPNEIDLGTVRKLSKVTLPEAFETRLHLVLQKRKKEWNLLSP